MRHLSKLSTPLSFWQRSAYISRQLSTHTMTTQAQSEIQAPEGKKSKEINIKNPKGTRDWALGEQIFRERIFDTILKVFKRHGGTALDTPVFELREILAGKYGEDSKLIYDLQDQGGEICSLRYDLTVPFARWLSMNTDIEKVKRYHLAKVYRRDQPVMTKGRMREFYQCDFDIAGTYDSMMPDAECLCIVSEVFDSLKMDDYHIKLNHRKILDGIFSICGVEPKKIRNVSSSIDKLDKLPWAEVRKELIDIRELSPACADKIWSFVQRKGSKSMLEELKTDAEIMADKDASQGIAELELLFGYLDAMNVSSKVVVDMSLARGLDYYTGLIYEVICTESAASSTNTSQCSGPKTEDSVGVGSLAAGGRYDELVGMFRKSKGKPKSLPCVGISFGVERIYAILRGCQNNAVVADKEVDVYVMSFGGGSDYDGHTSHRIQICKELWDAGISAEYLYKRKPKSRQQFEAAEKSGAQIAVIIGSEELKGGHVRVKRLGLKDDSDEGQLVERKDVVSAIRKELEQVDFQRLSLD